MNGSVATFTLVKARSTWSAASVIPLLESVSRKTEMHAADKFVVTAIQRGVEAMPSGDRGDRPTARRKSNVTNGPLIGPNGIDKNRRLRTEFIAGAEEEWHKQTGRDRWAEELERVLRR